MLSPRHIHSGNMVMPLKRPLSEWKIGCHSITNRLDRISDDCNITFHKTTCYAPVTWTFKSV